MTRQVYERVEIKKVPSGVTNLDVVLGGGIPVSSVNMIAGPPGSGKTTLVHQILFHNATTQAKALYFVALGEPSLKMLRYQQQFDFFDPGKIESAILYHDIGSIAREQGLAKTLEFIVDRVEDLKPAFVVIDSSRSLKDVAEERGENVRGFVHDLSSILGAWSVTSFLLGEYNIEAIESLSEFSAADGIIWMSQQTSGNSVIRKLQVIKIRGQASLAGRHTFRIDDAGVEVFPRMLPISGWPDLPLQRERLAFGIPGLDKMMSGGVPQGESLLIAGSSGTGKTLAALHFMAEGVKHGEAGVMVTFEEHPREHERKASGFGWDLKDWEKRGLLGMIYLRPLDLSVDEVLSRAHDMVHRLKARRVVINSISGFELGISPSDEPDFREALFRLIATLSGEGITTLMTTETPNVFGELTISPRHISFLADNVIMLRYAEIESQLRRVVMVVKMRTSDHDKDLKQFRITSRGILVEESFKEYSGVLSGIPTLRALIEPRAFTAGLSDQEEALSHLLLALGDAGVEQISEGMGIDRKQVRKMLDKLVDTGYVVKIGTKEGMKYRVALISPAILTKRG